MLPLIFFTLLAAVTATPIQKRGTISSTDILAISSASSSCSGAQFQNECRSAAQAAPYIATSFSFFGINDFATQAALVAVMVYESGGFKYAINHWPGKPGQGTRNMQMPNFNLRYAEYLSTVTGSGVTQAKLQSATALEGTTGTDAMNRAVLDLVNTDQWGFASAAWFLTTQCGASAKQGLAAGTLDGWHAYLTQCLGASLTADRDSYWHLATSLRQWGS